MKTPLTLLIIILAIIGIADAGYITYEKFTGGVVACGGWFSCNTVLDSKWASIGPIPLSLLGLVYYTTVLILAGSLLLELPIHKPLVTLSKKLLPTFPDFTLAQLLMALTTFGFGFSAYLIFIMAVLIKGWCLYCLISATTCTLLFLTSLGLVRLPRQ